MYKHHSILTIKQSRQSMDEPCFSAGRGWLFSCTFFCAASSCSADHSTLSLQVLHDHKYHLTITRRLTTAAQHCYISHTEATDLYIYLHSDTSTLIKSLNVIILNATRFLEFLIFHSFVITVIQLIILLLEVNIKTYYNLHWT